jgi:hypothetical protein
VTPIPGRLRGLVRERLGGQPAAMRLTPGGLARVDAAVQQQRLGDAVTCARQVAPHVPRARKVPNRFDPVGWHNHRLELTGQR